MLFISLFLIKIVQSFYTLHNTPNLLQHLPYTIYLKSLILHRYHTVAPRVYYICQSFESFNFLLGNSEFKFICMRKICNWCVSLFSFYLLIAFACANKHSINVYTIFMANKSNFVFGLVIIVFQNNKYMYSSFPIYISIFCINKYIGYYFQYLSVKTILIQLIIKFIQK